MTGAAAEPTRTFDGDVPVGADGPITLPVTNGDQGDGAGRQRRVVRRHRAPGAGQDRQRRVPVRQQRIRQPAVRHHAGVNDFMISAWVNPSADTAWSRVFDFGTGTGDYMFLTLNAGDSAIRFAITTSGAGGAADQRRRRTAPQHLVERGGDALGYYRDALRQRHGGRHQPRHDPDPGRSRRHHPGLDRAFAVPGRPLPGREDRRLPHLQQCADRRADRHPRERAAGRRQRRGRTSSTRPAAPP